MKETHSWHSTCNNTAPRSASDNVNQLCVILATFVEWWYNRSGMTCMSFGNPFVDVSIIRPEQLEFSDGLVGKLIRWTDFRFDIPKVFLVLAVVSIDREVDYYSNRGVYRRYVVVDLDGREKVWPMFDSEVVVLNDAKNKNH